MSLTVDVLIPTYHPHPEHFREALDALQAQTYPHWSAFIHDESTAVDVAALVAPYLRDARFRFARAPKRLGIGGNWNACLRRTSAPVVAYLFHDDYWHPEYLERAVAVLEAHPDIGMVSMDHAYRIDGEMVTAQEYRDLQAWKRAHLHPGRQHGWDFLRWWIAQGLRPNILGEPSFCVLRRSVMDRVGMWNEEMPQSLDAEYWVRMLQQTDWWYVPEESGYFRVHEDGTTARNRREGRGLFDRFRILQELIDRLPPGPDRSAALRAQVDQFREMAEKYIRKRERGDRIGYGGAGIVKKFALRHPVLTMGVLLRSFCTREGKRLRRDAVP